MKNILTILLLTISTIGLSVNELPHYNYYYVDVELNKPDYILLEKIDSTLVQNFLNGKDNSNAFDGPLVELTPKYLIKVLNKPQIKRNKLRIYYQWNANQTTINVTHLGLIKIYKSIDAFAKWNPWNRDKIETRPIYSFHLSQFLNPKLIDKEQLEQICKKGITSLWTKTTSNDSLVYFKITKNDIAKNSFVSITSKITDNGAYAYPMDEIPSNKNIISFKDQYKHYVATLKVNTYDSLGNQFGTTDIQSVKSPISYWVPFIITTAQNSQGQLKFSIMSASFLGIQNDLEDAEMFPSYSSKEVTSTLQYKYEDLEKHGVIPPGYQEFIKLTARFMLLGSCTHE